MTSSTDSPDEDDEWQRLLAWLSPAHRETALNHGYFDLLVQGRTYRIILYAGVYNVLRMLPGERKIDVRFCLTVNGALYIPSLAIAQAMTLMLEPDEFLAIANKSIDHNLTDYTAYAVRCMEYREYYVQKLRVAARSMGIAVP